MKKMCLVLVFLVFASWVYAVDFKILGGINLSRSTEPLAGHWIEEYSATTQYGAGVLFGAGVEFYLSQSVALEVDGFYFQKGSRLELRYWDEVVGHSIDRMNELSFPVLLKIYLRPGTSPYLLGGGEFAFVLANQSDPYNYGFVSQRTEYGLVFGAGLRKQINRAYISVEGRYNHGLQDMRSDFSMLRKMRVFSLIVGVSF